MASGP